MMKSALAANAPRSRFSPTQPLAAPRFFRILPCGGPGLAALALALVSVPFHAQAGPCTAEVDRLQAQVDAMIEATAGTGRTERESTNALLHREPTPGSMLLAEEKLGEGAAVQEAAAALAQARGADQQGDAASCERALMAARQAMGR